MSIDISALSLIQLRCFLAVIDRKTFAAAGRQLAMTTSGVSKTVARLEAVCGARLLHRSTHALSLTQAGERLIAPARAAVEAMEEAQTVMADVSSGGVGSGRVRISAPTAFVRKRLILLVPKLAMQRPDISLDIRASDETVDLAEGGIDLALRSGSINGLPGVVRKPWFSFPWVVCASPRYLEGKPALLEPADLQEHALIGFRNARTGLIEPWRLREYRSPGVVPREWRLVVDDGEAAWFAVLNGVGLAWAPYWLAANDLETGKVVEVLKEWRSLETAMSIIRRDRKLVPERVAAVISFLVGEAETFRKEAAM